MLNSRSTGASLIELMIGIAIFSTVLGLAAPSFGIWIQNTQVRTASDGVQNGLQLARAEAIRRNKPVRFQLTSSLDSSCALSTTGTDWVVSLDDPSGACGNAPSDTVAPRILQTRAGAEASSNVRMAADQTTIVFNSLGRITPVPAGTIQLNLSNPTGGACVSVGGNVRCLRVVVSVSGQIRLCDPALASTDVRGC